MQVIRLSENPDYLRQAAELIFNEWSYLPLWADEEQVRHRLAERNAAGSTQMTLVVIDEKNAVVATGSLIHYELNDNLQRKFWMGEIVTRPSSRGQGIATALVSQLVRHATEHAMEKLWLYTPDMQSLYRKLGWKDEEQRVVHGESVTVMVFDLAKPGSVI